MDYKTLLNERQYEAVSSDAQYLRIVAGAGSGKTRVLTYRISYLISEMDVSPKRILAIAFTNKVAKEMKERAVKLVPSFGEYIQILTFHSFCARFLRREIKALGFPTFFTIYDEDDQEKVVKNIGEEMGYRKNDDIIKSALKYISYQKCAGRYPESIPSLTREAFAGEKICLEIYRKYEERKNSQYCLDFDDLLLRTIEILEKMPDIRSKWQYSYDHILVDEFQDTNDVQFHLMKLLTKPSTNVYVVGDPDQTIYTWRGANQDIILNFEKEYPGAKTIILNENYRSTKTILDTANKLIGFNKKRVKKDLFTENVQGEKIEINKLYSKEEEAESLIKQINKIKKDNADFSFRQVAVLYRSSYLTLPLEKELARSRIPYKLFGGLRFYQRKEIKDVIAYFRLLLNTLDDVSFERIINVPKRGIGETSLDILKKEASKENKSIYNYLLTLDATNTELKTKTVVALDEMIKKMEKTKKALNENLEVYSKVLEDFIIELGYYDYLTSDEEDGEDRLENVKALFADIYSFLKENPDSTFEEYIQNVTLATSQDEIDDGEYVSLMTIHIAKGLEFDYVFVIGLEEGVFPSARTMLESGADGIEEERRLCYVAFTRAKKKLFLSCNTDYSFILQSRQIPSQFFKEAGLEFKKEESYKPYSSQGTSWNKNPTKSNNFFSDGDHISPFNEKPNIVEEKEIKDNGVIDWRVGDSAYHEKFGDGIVTKIIDDTIIEVDFDSCGKKSILASHPMISKKKSAKGDA